MTIHVKIFQPAKTAMQSGRAKTKGWRMEFDEQVPKFVDPLMGWVGQKDTTQQLKLLFETKEEALAYAEKKGYAVRIVEPHARVIAPKSYADNFRYNKVSV